MQKRIPSSMYKKHILELYKDPSNFGSLKKPTHEATEFDSICGDEVTVQLRVKDGKVKDVKFNGSGCVISLVSASILTDKIKGMKIEAIPKFNKDNILKLLGIKLNPSRVKCALLPLKAIKKSLKNA
jgi:nitrogen fixation NifU-like protein